MSRLRWLKAMDVLPRALVVLGMVCLIARIYANDDFLWGLSAGFVTSAVISAVVMSLLNDKKSEADS